ncbi:MAG TPA: DUF3617 domain-containing protein [Burkholderiales bacterium]|nr:DUF3617 domain-containing protein [Burkholderiales bacterium]
MRALFLAILALVGADARADDLSPGLWQMTVETRMPSTPGFAPAPVQVNQCFTAEDARNPERLLGQIANPGASGCTYTSKSYSGNTFSFTMQCAGAFAIESSGRVRFTSDSMDGTIDGTANVGGNTVQMQNRISARRVGGC